MASGEKFEISPELSAILLSLPLIFARFAEVGVQGERTLAWRNGMGVALPREHGKSDDVSGLAVIRIEPPGTRASSS